MKQFDIIMYLYYPIPIQLLKLTNTMVGKYGGFWKYYLKYSKTFFYQHLYKTIEQLTY